MNTSQMKAPSRRDMLTTAAAVVTTAVGASLAACGDSDAQAQMLGLPARPEDVQPYWGATFNAGDLDAVMRVYTDDAVFVPQPGTLVRGKDAIRKATFEFMALKLTFTMKQRHILVSGDTALLVADWTLEGAGLDGNPMKLAGATSDVARRQADGIWLIVIDNPFGTA